MDVGSQRLMSFKELESEFKVTHGKSHTLSFIKTNIFPFFLQTKRGLMEVMKFICVQVPLVKEKVCLCANMRDVGFEVRLLGFN